MKNWLQALQRGAKYRVTRGGFLFILAVTLIETAAVASANNLLFLVVATMLSVLLVSGLVSRLGLAGLDLDFASRAHQGGSGSRRHAGCAQRETVDAVIFRERGRRGRRDWRHRAADSHFGRLLPHHPWPRDPRRNSRAAIPPPRGALPEQFHRQGLTISGRTLRLSPLASSAILLVRSTSTHSELQKSGDSTNTTNSHSSSARSTP
jgi:hypothetical protein